MNNNKRDYSNLDCCLNKCQVEEENSILKSFADFTLPGFHYLGPGSRTNNGPPTNAIDAIAQRHDEAYDRVVKGFRHSRNVKRSVEQIEEADQQFLEDMRHVTPNTTIECVGKAVGLVGIGLKAAVEKSLGITIYPDFDMAKDCEQCPEESSTGDDSKREQK
uniref:Phospholipase A2-like domain-containing protein n=1 Tax=Graphocephala atropunctata TaxID=36148 RepID=A0A1B6MVE3_9HEMI